VVSFYRAVGYEIEERISMGKRLERANNVTPRAVNDG
jgi:hypothetical protein